MNTRIYDKDIDDTERSHVKVLSLNNFIRGFGRTYKRGWKTMLETTG